MVHAAAADLLHGGHRVEVVAISQQEVGGSKLGGHPLFGGRPVDSDDLGGATEPGRLNDV